MGVVTVDVLVSVVLSGSMGSEPVRGTLGSAGGVAPTNVGVHDGRRVDASESACRSTLSGPAEETFVGESETGHCMSCACMEGSAASLVMPVSEFGDVVVTVVCAVESMEVCESK